jgi:hypothetical protein
LIPWCVAVSCVIGVAAVGDAATGDAPGVASCANTGANDDSAISDINTTVSNDHRVCRSLIDFFSLRRPAGDRPPGGASRLRVH